jgi:hypothetical protein
MSFDHTHITTKQSILNRMLRLATDFTGARSADLLDPVIMLFVESLAEEIHKLSDEIGNIESRMLETLSGMLCTDISLSAHPAHCILHAIPEESKSILTKETAFVLNDKRQQPKEVKKMTFYPVCDTPVHKGRVRYMIHNGLCCQIEKDLSKTLLSRSRDAEFVRTNSFWIALEIDEAIQTLKDLSFYFDFSAAVEKEEYLRLLPFMTWKLNGKGVQTRQGLYTISAEIANDMVALFENWKISEKLNASILNSYNKHFQTIDEELNILPEKTLFPKELVGYFPPHLTEDFTTPLLWFEIVCPPKLKTAVTETMTVCINALPVSNKYLHSKTMEMNRFLQVIPLATDNHESLLSVHSLTDASATTYFELPFEDTPEKRYRTYSLRRGGYERYSKRELKEYLTNLIPLIDNHLALKAGDQSAEKGQGVQAVLLQMHDLATHLKKVIADTKEKLDIQHYILIDKQETDNVFFIKYWTTNCEQANNIKAHTVMECAAADISVDVSSLFTLTATIGGKYAPQPVERQLLRKKSLTAGTILVTDEDIVGFCKSELGNLVEELTISKGITESPKDKLTFLHTTDITLVPFRGNSAVFEQFDIEKFRGKLQKNSPATFKYRIFIDNKTKN